MMKSSIFLNFLGLMLLGVLASCAPKVNKEKMPGVPENNPKPTFSPPALIGELKFQQNVYDFGSQIVSSESVQYLNVKNIGEGKAEIKTSEIGHPFSFVGGEFPGDGGTCNTTIRAGEECVVAILFHPTNSGSFNQRFALLYDSGKKVISSTTHLKGVGLTPANLVVLGDQTVDFGTNVVNSTSRVSVTISNNGQAPASGVEFLTATAPFGFDNNEYPGSGGTCGAVIYGGETCTINPKFTPIIPGLFAGNVKLTYFNGEEQQELSVGVIGESTPEAELAFNEAPKLEFGNVTVGLSSTKTITLVNLTQTPASLSGFGTSVSSPFSIEGGTCSTVLAGGASCTVIIKFTPTSSESTSQYPAFSYHSGVRNRIASITLTGKGISGPLLTISDSPSYSFGTLVEGQTSERVFTVTNLGESAASNVTISGFTSNFELNTGTCGSSLAAGASCLVSVQYSPKTIGNHSTQIVIDYSVSGSSPSSQVTLNLSGNSITEGLVVFNENPSYDFLSTIVGTSKNKILTVSNTGDSKAIFTTSSVSAPFSFTGGSFPGTNGTCGSEISGKSSCTISVSFTPSQVGTFTSDIILNYTTAGKSKSASMELFGDAVSGDILSFIESPLYDFTDVVLGQTSTVVLNLRNGDSNEATNLSFSSLTSPFVVKSSTCGTELAGLASCQITIEFSPESAGLITQELTVSYNNETVNKSTSISLQGKGITPGQLIFADSPEYNFGTKLVGSSSLKILSVSNIGESQVENILSSISGEDFSFTEGSYPGTGGTCGTTLAPGESCLLSVSFNPQNSGAKLGTLQLNYGTNSSVSITLKSTVLNKAKLLFYAANFHDFGNQIVGSSTIKVIKITNVGGVVATELDSNGPTAPFQFTGGSYPGINGTCGDELSKDASCLLEVAFNPTNSGTIVKSPFIVSYNDGMSSSSATYHLSGSASTPASLGFIEESPYDFGPKTVRTVSEKTFTILNNGESASSSISFETISAPFSIKSTTCSGSVDAGSSCLVTIEFNPQSTAGYDISLFVNYFNGLENQQTSIQLMGTGISTASLAFDYNPYDFGTVLVAESSQKVLKVTNTGATKATGLNLNGLQSPFSYQDGSYPGTGGNCGTELNPGSECLIVLNFTPTAKQIFNSQIGLEYNNGAESAEATVNLTGEGKLEDAKFDSSLIVTVDFGLVLTGTSSVKTITITNSGQEEASNLVFNSPSVPFGFTGGSFPGTNGTCSTSLGGGESCTVEVQFSPSVIGDFNSSILLSYFNGTSNDSVIYPITGHGSLEGSLASSEPAVNFGNFNLDDENFEDFSYTFTFTNDGDYPVSSLSFTAYTPFKRKVNECPAVLQPGESCNYSITFQGNPLPQTYETEIRVNYNNGRETIQESIPLTITFYYIPGSLDRKYGTEGISYIPIGVNSLGIKDSLFINNSVVNVGFAESYTKDMAAFKLMQDGTSLDSNFGFLGIATSDNSGQDFANAGTKDSSGNIYIGGYSGSNGQGFVSKFNSNGEIVTSFGSNGNVFQQFSSVIGTTDEVKDLVVSGDGLFVLTSSGKLLEKSSVLWRYDLNGSVKGKKEIDTFLRYNYASSLAARVSGNLIAGGEISTLGRMSLYLAELNSAGSYVTSFGSSGVKEYNIDPGKDHSLKDLIVLANNKILMLYTTKSSGSSPYQLYLMRLKSNGDIDTTFGTNGKVSLGAWSTKNTAHYRMATQNDGKILIATTLESGSTFLPAIVRLTSEGAIDSPYGVGGVVLVDSVSALNEKNVGLTIDPATGKAIFSTVYSLNGEEGILSIRLNP